MQKTVLNKIILRLRYLTFHFGQNFSCEALINLNKLIAWLIPFNKTEQQYLKLFPFELLI